MSSSITTDRLRAFAATKGYDLHVQDYTATSSYLYTLRKGAKDVVNGKTKAALWFWLEDQP
jgi:hypothetical protein